MPWFNIIISVIVLILLLATLFVIVLSFRNAPYYPTNDARLQAMLELLDIQPDDIAVDLGSGDGRIVIAMALAGAKESHGYEINPWLVLWTKWQIRRYKLHGKAFAHWKSLWNVDLRRFTVVALYILTHVMPELETKLKKDLPAGARVASNAFQFPTWSVAKEKESVRLYRVPPKRK